MRAAVYDRYGPPDVVQIRDIPRPAPKPHEVLIETRATTVTSADWRVRSLVLPSGFGPLGRLAFGIARPRQPVLGTELSGVVVAVGASVTRFKPGDAVFAFSDAAMGCHAQYKCMPEQGAVVLKPASLTFGEAAALSFGGTTVLDFFRRGQLQRGERLLVNGASGAVGTAAVQLARHLGQTWDVVMDNAGTAPWRRSGPVLTARGRLLLVLGGLADMLHAPWVALTSRKRVIAGPVAVRVEDLHQLAALAEAGAFRPVIDQHYPFERIVDAHRHVDSGRKRGNLVVLLAPDGLH